MSERSESDSSDEHDLNKDLLVAAVSGDEDRVTEVFHQGADVLTKNEGGDTGLHLKAEKGYLCEHCQTFP